MIFFCSASERRCWLTRRASWAEIPAVSADLHLEFENGQTNCTRTEWRGGVGIGIEREARGRAGETKILHTKANGQSETIKLSCEMGPRELPNGVRCQAWGLDDVPGASKTRSVSAGKLSLGGLRRPHSSGAQRVWRQWQEICKTGSVGSRWPGLALKHWRILLPSDSCRSSGDGGSVTR